MVAFLLLSPILFLPNALAASGPENSVDVSVSAAASSLSRGVADFLNPSDLVPKSVSDLFSPAPQLKAGTLVFERPDHGRFDFHVFLASRDATPP